MMSVKLREVYKLAEKYDSKLKATDKRFAKVTRVKMHDGAQFTIPAAFSKSFKGYADFVFIFSEHYLIIYLEKDMIESIKIE